MTCKIRLTSQNSLLLKSDSIPLCVSSLICIYQKHKIADKLLYSVHEPGLVRLSLFRKIFQSLCLPLVIFEMKTSEEHEGEMARCLHSLSKTLKHYSYISMFSSGLLYI